MFVAILALGLAYVWIKGDLDWVGRSKEDAHFKPIGHDPSPAGDGEEA